MVRGIWRHGRLKTFLTRGLPGPVFRPFLYGKDDWVHAAFASGLTSTLDGLNHLGGDQQALLRFWLVVVPKQFFEEIFCPDETGELRVPVLQFAERGRGGSAAYLTQAYVLWNLQQMLANSETFANSMGFTTGQLEEAVSLICGEGSEVGQYWECFRDRLDLEKLEIDPRDWPVFYVAQVCQLLVPDQDMVRKVLQPLDADAMARDWLVIYDVNFFASQKSNALALAERA